MTLEKAKLLVSQFELGTLPKQEWTHTAHFAMALLYCLQLPLTEAVVKIRNGIKAYNSSVGGRNTDTAGYHETVTLFYTSVIAAYIVSAGIQELTDEQMAVFCRQPFLEKDYIFRFYSKEALFSREARLQWLAPDKQPASFF